MGRANDHPGGAIRALQRLDVGRCTVGAVDERHEWIGAKTGPELLQQLHEGTCGGSVAACDDDLSQLLQILLRNEGQECRSYEFGQSCR